MPNWCEGKLKVRGKKENIMKWLAECVAVWNPDVEKGKPLYDALVFKKIQMEFRLPITMMNFMSA